MNLLSRSLLSPRKSSVSSTTTPPVSSEESSMHKTRTVDTMQSSQHTHDPQQQSQRAPVVHWRRFPSNTVPRQDPASCLIFHPASVSSEEPITKDRIETALELEGSDSYRGFGRSNGLGVKNSRHGEGADQSTSMLQMVGWILVGGRNKETSQIQDTVELLEWNSQRWWTLPSLQYARCGCAVASFHKTIYVLGGMGRDDRLLSVESYTVGKDKSWAVKESMHLTAPRWYGAAIVLPVHNEMILLGGRDDSWQELDTVQSYSLNQREDSHTSTWKSRASMSSKRFAFGCTRTANSQKIFVAGGYNGEVWLDSCELYNYDYDMWAEVAPMPQALEFCTAMCLGSDYIIVSGKQASSQGHPHGESEAGPHSSRHHRRGGDDERIGADVPSSRSDRVLMFCYTIAEDKWITMDMGKSSHWSAAATTVVGSKLLTVDSGGSASQSKPHSARISTDLYATLNGDENLSRGSDHSGSRSRASRNSSGGGGGGGTRSRGGKRASIRRSIPDNSNHQQDDDDSVVPWWATPAQSSVRKLTISAEDMDHISVMQESDTMSIASMNGHMTASSNHLMSPGGSIMSSRHRHRRRLSTSSGPSLKKSSRHNSFVVEREDREDPSGRKVSYSGQMSNNRDRPHGKGQMKWKASGNVYKGDFRQGFMEGYGQMVYKNGDTFEGLFHKDKRVGRGLYRWEKTGRTYDGNYEDDVAHDPNGTMTWKDETIYMGSFVQGKRTGTGIQRFKTGVRYEGSFVNGKYEGFGTCKFQDGSVYEGNWVKGRAHGNGCLVNANGDVVHDGIWEMDAPIGEGFPGR